MQTKNYYYDQRTELMGAVRELAEKKLGASASDKIEFGEYSWNAGYCETCSWERYEFTVILNDEIVYDSKQSGQYVSSVFAALQEWLTT